MSKISVDVNKVLRIRDGEIASEDVLNRPLKSMEVWNRLNGKESFVADFVNNIYWKEMVPDGLQPTRFSDCIEFSRTELPSVEIINFAQNGKRMDVRGEYPRFDFSGGKCGGLITEPEAQSLFDDDFEIHWESENTVIEDISIEPPRVPHMFQGENNVKYIAIGEDARVYVNKFQLNKTDGFAVFSVYVKAAFSYSPFYFGIYDVFWEPDTVIHVTPTDEWQRVSVMVDLSENNYVFQTLRFVIAKHIENQDASIYFAYPFLEQIEGN